MAPEDFAFGERQTSISTVLAKRLFDTSLDLILVTDRRGQFIEISPSSLATLGYRPEEMKGHIGSQFIYPDDLDRTRNEMRQARRGRQTRNFESRYVHKKGQIVPLAWNGTWSEIEQLHFFIGRDLTEAKLTERLQNKFVATVSHELRTPLTSIAGALGLLTGDLEATLPASTMRLLTIAQANSQRLLRLVSGILDIDKIESGKVVFVLKQINIHALVELAIEANRGSAKDLGVCIKLEAAPDASKLRGDPDWLFKAVSNLISNALKFSPPGGEVSVAIESRDDTIRISVRDHGPGVPDEFKDRVFEKFAQADTSDARNKGSVGLGLSIVKQIVKRLGGEAGFANSPGGGAIFHVELPAWGQNIATESEFHATPIVVSQ